MVWLKFYQNERQLFPEAFNHKLTDEEAWIVVKKLKRHFKIPVLGMKFWGRKREAGHANKFSICLPHNPSMGILCHELAHVYNARKYGNWGHNKKLMKTIGRFIKYCEKKNYWKKEVDTP